MQHIILNYQKEFCIFLIEFDSQMEFNKETEIQLQKRFSVAPGSILSHLESSFQTIPRKTASKSLKEL